MAESNQQIEELIKSNPVVLFMKGSKSFPQCGFSATCVQILNQLVPEYKTVNVLADQEIRAGIKSFSNWPTIPQLYVNGEFVGGCDIVRDMFSSGDLATKLGVSGEVAPPSVTVTDAAVAQLKEALEDAEQGDTVQLSIDASFRVALGIGPAEDGHIEVETNGITIAFDKSSVARAEGITIDFREGAAGAGFKIDNPNAPPDVVELSPADLRARLAAGEVKELFDVRTPEERNAAKIDNDRHLDEAAMGYIEGLAKDTALAFYCRSGKRSQAMAEHFVSKGYTKVYNLAGGILAWSAEA
jgi:monothiol glutaredoxin